MIIINDEALSNSQRNVTKELQSTHTHTRICMYKFTRLPSGRKGPRETLADRESRETQRIRYSGTFQSPIDSEDWSRQVHPKDSMITTWAKL